MGTLIMCIPSATGRRWEVQVQKVVGKGGGSDSNSNFEQDGRK
jgi:hypothetical protein